MGVPSFEGEEISLPRDLIFNYIVDFDALHHHCIQFIDTGEQRPDKPELRLKFVKKQGTCSCSEEFLENLKNVSNHIPETELVDLFKDDQVQQHISENHCNDEDIVLRWVSHLQDICIEKGFENLRRTLKVTDLSGYEEIFHCFVDFENGLHKIYCITFLPLSGAKEKMRKMPLRLKLLDKKGDCKCSENFLDKMKDTLDDVQESKLVYIFKVYLQGYVRNQNNYDTDIACRLVSHLQDISISKSLPELARYCFQTNMTAEKLIQILTVRFYELSDKITAVVISEIDSKSVRSIFSSSTFYENMKIIMRERSETLSKLMEKLVDQEDNVKCKILEMDDNCRTPDQTEFDFFSYTLFQQIAYRGMEEVVCSTAYQRLTEEKWENWCRRAFARDAVIYLISIVLLTFVAVTSVNAPNVVVYQSPLDYTRAIFEIVLLLYAACIFVIEIYQAFRLKKEYFMDNMNIIEISSPVLLILLLPMRYIHEQTHWYIYAVTYLVWFLQIVKYALVSNYGERWYR